MSQNKVKVQTKEEKEKTVAELRRHYIGLFRIGARLFPKELLKEAKKLEKQAI